MQFKFGESYPNDAVNLGDTVQLQKGSPLEVVECQESGVKMLNIDADQIQPGDLKFIKSLGLTISNPDTEKPVALGVDYIDDSWGHKIHDYLTSDSDDSDNSDDDDSSFFSGGSFLAGLGSSGFSGGSSFGGFGGGSFSGGGASAGF